MQKRFSIKSTKLVLLFIIPMVCVMCRKKLDVATWDTNAIAPLAHGEVNLTDLVEAEELQSDVSGLIHVRAKDTLLNIGLDSLIGIPDTAFNDEFSIPFSFTISPGVPFYDTTSITRYNLKEVQLTYAEVRNSLFSVKLTNTTKTQILALYSIPSATLPNGDTFKLERLIPAKSSLTEEFNLNGYRLNLRGRQNRSYNTIVSKTVAMVDPAQDPYTFAAGEGFEIENKFKRIIPQYVRGFFGRQNVTYRDSSAIDLLKRLQYKSIDISEFKVDMTVDNGIGADLRLNIEELGSSNNASGASALLEHALIGDDQFFGRAIYLGYQDNPVKHVVKTFSFTDENSNLDELLELNPSRLFYDLNLGINPLGDISYGNDFAYYGHDLTAVMDVDIPLKVGVEGLVLQDTFAFLFKESNPEEGSGRINSGFLRAHMTNGYPFSTLIQFYIQDSTGTEIDSLLAIPQRIEAAPVDDQGRVTDAVKSVIEMAVDQSKIENLKAGRFLRLRATIDTYEKGVVNVYDNYTIGFKLVADLNVNVP